VPWGHRERATGEVEYRSDPERGVGYSVNWQPPGKERWRAGKACGMAVMEPEGEGICNYGWFPPLSNAHLQETSTIRRTDLAHRRTFLSSSLSRSYILVDYNSARAQARRSGITKVTAYRIGLASGNNEKAEGTHCTIPNACRECWCSRKEEVGRGWFCETCFDTGSTSVIGKYFARHVKFEWRGVKGLRTVLRG
jgi:hypothetical protein